ncbi:MAG TPA: glycosyltransferase family 4 protein [Bacteroidales bacterium]|nr:glycosyltransferase family 4 protein [Bacteroidales bacterium]
MKILILTNKMPYPPRDGGSIASLTLAKSLQKCGNDVEILSMNTSKHYFDLDKLPEEISSKLKFYSVNINTETKLIKAVSNFLFSSVPYNAARFISKDYEKKLSEILQKNTYDIIQLEGLYLCPYIDTIRKYSKAKISLRAHNIEHEIWTRAAVNETQKLKKIYKKNLASRIRKFKLNYINKYDFLIPITSRDGNLYTVFGNTMPIHVTPTGIDSDNTLLQQELNSSEFPGFFHIGALDWIPNIEGLTWFIEKVWKEFSRKYPNYGFSIAGRNASTEFEKYLIQNNINYVGEVDNASEFISKGAVMIVPLLSGSGMRIKIIEGMAAGKTIITTSMGTEGINTTNDENILIADTAESFYSQLIRVSKSRELHGFISQQARNFVIKNYDNDKIATSLTEFYKNNIS